MYELFKSVFHSFLFYILFLDIILVGFQSQMFWRLVSSVQDLGVAMPDVELESLAAQEKDSYLCESS